MNYTEFENLLCKHISIAEEAIGNEFENKLFKKNTYYILDDTNKKDFYGMQYNHLTIVTNDEDIVESITIYFRGVINRQFYDSFIEKYGEPNNIQIVENRKMESETILKDEKGKITQHLTKNTFDLREGSFEEKPLYIIWNKEHFQVKAFLRQKQNMSQITFKKID